ncbi:MAG: imidazole glycerol phosphate synthase subunit HisH [Bacteroidales bacterium]
MSAETVIIRYNAGNIRSVYNALQRLGEEAKITDNPDEIKKAKRVIFPGVGEASSTMHHLKEKQLDKLIINLTQPVLAICLGTQLLCQTSEEGNAEGLGIIKEKVKKFDEGQKIPHMGWNRITNLQGPVFKDIEEGSFVYFVHSYYVPLTSVTSAECSYGVNFSAALQYKNFYATQFHPEKSGNTGKQILKNFLQL